jgi:hypothetical protein
MSILTHFCIYQDIIIYYMDLFSHILLLLLPFSELSVASTGSWSNLNFLKTQPTCQIRIAWQHLMSFTCNTTFSTTPHTIHVKFNFLDHASCLIPHASCLMPHASCLMPYASCLMSYASCIMHQASCIMHHAS